MTDDRLEQLANELGEVLTKETSSEEEYADALDGIITTLEAARDAARENIARQARSRSAALEAEKEEPKSDPVPMYPPMYSEPTPEPVPDPAPEREPDPPFSGGGGFDGAGAGGQF